MELLRTGRLLLRHWDESDVAAFFDVYSREEVARWLGAHPRKPVTTVAEARERLGRWREHERGLSAPLGLWAIVPYAAARAVLALAGEAGIDEVFALTDLDNAPSQRVAERLGMADEGVTERWFGETMRQYRKVIRSQIGRA